VLAHLRHSANGSNERIADIILNGMRLTPESSLLPVEVNFIEYNNCIIRSALHSVENI
jgi:hypothetical protein